MILAGILLLCPAQEPAAPAGPAEAVASVLVRAGEPDPAAFARAIQELAALSEAWEPLLEALGTARAPGQDGARLGPRQLELVLAALGRLDPVRLEAFVDEVERDPRSAARIAAALRLTGARGRAADVSTLLALARHAEARGEFEPVEEAFQEALAALLAREPRSHGKLSGSWGSLGPLAASAGVRAVERARTGEGLALLRAVLGRSAALDAPVLVALGNLAGLVLDAGDADLAAELAQEVVPYLDSRSPAEVQAAAAALGRLGVPETVPDLVECLADERPACVRAALAALRAIGGVGLPASPVAWRAWYGREQTWWLDRAPMLFEQLSGVHAGQEEPGDFSAWLREASEHRLHRHEIAAGLVSLLAHPRPLVRVLTCQCLERLDSRVALPRLAALLDDRASEVVAAAHAALVAIARVELPPERAAWVEHLASSGPTRPADS